MLVRTFFALIILGSSAYAQPKYTWTGHCPGASTELFAELKAMPTKDLKVWLAQRIVKAEKAPGDLQGVVDASAATLQLFMRAEDSNVVLMATDCQNSSMILNVANSESKAYQYVRQNDALYEGYVKHNLSNPNVAPELVDCAAYTPTLTALTIKDERNLLRRVNILLATIPKERVERMINSTLYGLADAQYAAQTLEAVAKAALAKQIESFDVHWYLSVSYVCQGQLKSALSELKIVHKISPNNRAVNENITIIEAALKAQEEVSAKPKE